eukprot:CAMPEP_0180649474 /NCGR_PEP_ID=MMETSP1037_2-20121125/51608_1 /TAXON_ID=632150 /ORGANISM="Azadinium spinosum, Strain 3D9" /LENGTH=60 /DNA_ID=CAMNT_0022674533 /DNA_START=34 /DNA_END=216 /DNA_ORIENTATION=-
MAEMKASCCGSIAAGARGPPEPLPDPAATPFLEAVSPARVPAEPRLLPATSPTPSSSSSI